MSTEPRTELPPLTLRIPRRLFRLHELDALARSRGHLVYIGADGKTLEFRPSTKGARDGHGH